MIKDIRVYLDDIIESSEKLQYMLKVRIKKNLIRMQNCKMQLSGGWALLVKQ